MLKIELVEQTTKFNCGSAALAMILGLPTPEHVERDHLGRDSSANHADRGIAIGQLAFLWTKRSECYLMREFQHCLTSTIYAA